MDHKAAPVQSRLRSLMIAVIFLGLIAAIFVQNWRVSALRTRLQVVEKELEMEKEIGQLEIRDVELSFYRSQMAKLQQEAKAPNSANRP